MFRNDVWQMDIMKIFRGNDNDHDDDDNDDLCKQSGRVMTIFNIGHADRRIWHPGLNFTWMAMSTMICK